MIPDVERPPESCVLVTNPHAGGGRGLAAQAEAARVLRKAGIALEVRETVGPGHAVSLAQRAAEDGVDAVVALGGDGTLHEVLNGVLQARLDAPPRLGVVPVGGGNDYARMLAVPDDPARAAQLVARGRTRRVDAGRLDGGHTGPEFFLNNVGLAFMGAANAARERTRFLPGRVSYIAAGALAFARLRAEQLTVSVDGVSVSGRFFIAHVGLGRYCGAGVLLTPEAELDDGRFEVFLLTERSRLRGALEWPRIARGEAGDDAAVLRGRRVRVMGPRGMVLHADGEVRSCPLGVLEATLLPEAIRVIHGA